MFSMARTLARLMIETTLRATSEKLWPGLVSTFGGPLIWPANRTEKNCSIAARPCGGFEVALGRDRAVVADGQHVAGIVEMGLQRRQPFVPLQHQEMRLCQPFGFRRIEARGAVFDGVAAVGRKRLARAQGRAVERLRGEAFDGIAVDTGDFRGWAGTSVSFKRFRWTAPPRRNCKSASSVLAVDAHICVKPDKMMATTAGWLRNVNAALRKPNEDAAAVPSGLSGRLREVNDEY